MVKKSEQKYYKAGHYDVSIQTQRAYQKQTGLNENTRKKAKKNINASGRLRFWKSVGLGFKTPKAAINGKYIDKKMLGDDLTACFVPILEGYVQCAPYHKHLKHVFELCDKATSFLNWNENKTPHQTKKVWDEKIRMVRRQQEDLVAAMNANETKDLQAFKEKLDLLTLPHSSNLAIARRSMDDPFEHHMMQIMVKHLVEPDQHHNFQGEFWKPRLHYRSLLHAHAHA
jgi:translation elongation factor EF-G